MGARAARGRADLRGLLMLALKVIGGMLFFVPLFIALGWGVGKLSENNRTGVAFVLLGAGLFFILIVTAAYGHAVR